MFLSRQNLFLLNIAAYVTLFTVAAPTILTRLEGQALAPALLLFGAFTLLLQLYTRLQSRVWAINAYLALQTGIIILLAYFYPQAAFSWIHLLFFILSAQATLLLPLPLAIGWIALYFGMTLGAGWYVFGWEEVFGLSATLGGHTLFGGFGALLRRADAERQESERLLVELQAAHTQLQAYAAQVEQLAVAEERNRLAREMHDALGHQLTVAIVQLEGAQRLIPSEPERAATIVGSMRSQLREALAELRRAVAALRAPETAVPDAPPSLKTAVAGLARTFEEATGLPVHLALDDDPPQLGADQRLALFRAAQEGLTNVQRHADADHAWLTLNHAHGFAELTVADDGRSYPAGFEDGRFGLRGLQERAERLGGELDLGERTGGGAQMKFRLPVTTVVPHA